MNYEANHATTMVLASGDHLDCSTPTPMAMALHADLDALRPLSLLVSIPRESSPSTLAKA